MLWILLYSVVRVTVPENRTVKLVISVVNCDLVFLDDNFNA